MKREEMIKELKGNYIRVDYEWLKENDPELIDFIYNHKYWGRGFDFNPDKEEIHLELFFEENGIEYIATFESHPDGVEQSLNNQGPWFIDNYEDLPLTIIETYYKEHKKQN